MAVTLVRHTTPDVAKGTCYGRTDLKLADTFEQEALDVIARVPKPRLVVSSPLTRCRLLAERLALEAKSDFRIVDHWIEMDFGSWEGMPWSSIPRSELDDWAADFHGYSGHGGESVAMLEQRVQRGLQDVSDGTLVVTHAGCIKAACAIHDVQDGWQTETAFGGLVTLG